MLCLGLFASVASASIAPTVKSKKLALGTVVVNANGRTLYHYTPDSKGHAKCTGACAATWPPLVVKAGTKAVAGAGIKAAKLGTLKRPDGTLQVTYGGFPLYTYSGDAKAGQANGEGLEGKWFALSPAAKLVKPAAASSNPYGAPATSTGSTATTGSGSTSGGGYDYGY